MNDHVAMPFKGPSADPAANSIGSRFFETRNHSLALARPLSAEDMVVQPSEDASPTKWHLAHTTWFFETFVLAKHVSGYRVFDDSFKFCFNSYYESLGPRQPRARRGLLTRPSLERVLAYRAHVDVAFHSLFETRTALTQHVIELIETGINHEQQHQELILTDILALFAANPLLPAYRHRAPVTAPSPPKASTWIGFEGGIRPIGTRADGFCWDNETPRHDVLVHPFCLADRLVTNGEWLEFIAAGGYKDPGLWLADGWALVKRDGLDAPLYWLDRDGAWQAMSLHGPGALDPAAPVVHVSYFEADAFARWKGARLPTEFEWETAAAGVATTEPAGGAMRLLPRPDQAGTCGRPRQMFGEVWQWTQSAYQSYPGYKPAVGALGEYNGKFMVSQQVLRGSSCFTPRGHSRPTYRNFFYPHQRWQAVGLRLAKDGCP